MNALTIDQVSVDSMRKIYQGASVVGSCEYDNDAWCFWVSVAGSAGQVAVQELAQVLPKAAEMLAARGAK